MGRTFMGCVALVLGLGLALDSAEAKDRKSAAAPDRESVSPLAARGSSTAAMRQEAARASSSRPESASLADRLSSRPNGTPIAPLADAQPARSNPLNLKLGAVTLQPAIGGIKGAQLSIGF